MIQINQTRLLNWISGLRYKSSTYKGYSWKFIGKEQAVSLSGENLFNLYTFAFYRGRKHYTTKSVGADSFNSLDDLAKAIIDFDGGFYIDDIHYDPD